MNISKTAVSFIGRKKKIFLIFFLVLAIAGLVFTAVRLTSTKKPEVKVESYKNIEDAIKSQIEPKRLGSLEAYDQALQLYREEDFSGAVKTLEDKIKEGASDAEIQSSYYALLYNCYLKLSQLENAKNTITRFKATDAYGSIDDGAKKQWDYQLKVLEDGAIPDPSAGGQ